MQDGEVETGVARLRHGHWWARGPSDRHAHRIEEDVVLSTPQDAAVFLWERVFCPFHKVDQEEMWVLLLTTKNKITHAVMVYRGVVSGTPVRVSEVFKDAIRYNAPVIVVAHCHPSGDPTPSPEDVRITAQVVAAGHLLDIDVLDHIVVGDGRFASMRERGLGF